MPRLLAEPRRERHNETHADAKQGTHHQQHIDVVDEEASSSCCHIEQQTRSGDGTCPQPSADGEEEEVGNDDKQRRHAHDELYEQGVCLREMSLDDAQCGGDGGSGHHGEQRHRQDGSRHSFRNVCFFHKNLWSCKLYQAIESFLKIGCKGTNKS